MPHIRPASTHSSPVFPASKDPMAKAKGMLAQINPAINMGGCMNIPKWVSSGFIPSPSGGTKGSLSNGLAMNPVTARKKTSTTIKTPVV